MVCTYDADLADRSKVKMEQVTTVSSEIFRYEVNVLLKLQ